MKFLHSLLRVPLYLKLFLANAALVGGAVGATAWLLLGSPETARATVGSPSTWIALVGILLFGAAVIHGAILFLALSPLDTLEETARRVSRGERDRRVPVSPLADRRLETLTRTFNSMLDAIDLSQEQFRRFTARILEVQEEERARMARDLHDDIGQRLASLLLRLGMLRTRFSEVPEDPRWQELRDELAGALDEIKSLARGLHPPALRELGLVSAVEAYLREVGERVPFTLELVRPDRDPEVSHETALAAFRIVQEAVTNARVHASPTRVRVTFAVEEGELRIDVEDDGVGFVANGIPHRRAGEIGLFGMVERGEYAGGKVRIWSAPGKGTLVTLRFPLGEREDGKEAPTPFITPGEGDPASQGATREPSTLGAKGASPSEGAEETHPESEAHEFGAVVES